MSHTSPKLEQSLEESGFFFLSYVDPSKVLPQNIQYEGPKRGYIKADGSSINKGELEETLKQELKKSYPNFKEIRVVEAHDENGLLPRLMSIYVKK